MSATTDLDELARRVAALPRPLLVACDVDGTLAPIAPRPWEANLAPGAVQALTGLRREDVVVAVVSGRPAADLTDHFGLPGELVLVGSHGAEMQGAAPPTSIEADRLAALTAHVEAIAAAHPGTYVEHKPFAVVLHVRGCPPDLAASAASAARHLAEGDEHVRVIEGHAVVELAVRHASKDLAVADVRLRRAAQGVVFVGDDRSDEDVFRAFATDAAAVGIKVGDGATAATGRLGTPDDVVALLQRLAVLL